MSDMNCIGAVPATPAPPVVHHHIVHHAPTGPVAWHAPIKPLPATSHGFAHSSAPAANPVVASVTPEGAHCLATPAGLRNLPAGPAVAPPLAAPIASVAPPLGRQLAAAALPLAAGGIGGASLAALGTPFGGSPPPPNPTGGPGFPNFQPPTPQPPHITPPFTPTTVHVPEPSSVVMFALAVLVLAALGWMRARRA